MLWLFIDHLRPAIQSKFLPNLSGFQLNFVLIHLQSCKREYVLYSAKESQLESIADQSNV